MTVSHRRLGEGLSEIFNLPSQFLGDWNVLQTMPLIENFLARHIQMKGNDFMVVSVGVGCSLVRDQELGLL